MPARRKDYDGAVEQYRRGDSVEVVAATAGITRQAMWRILLRRGVTMRPQLRYGASNHFHRGGHPTDTRVHSILAKAISRGQIVPRPCEECGRSGSASDGRNTVEAHHDDYNKPLEIRWLCGDCHRAWHATHEPIRRTRPLPPTPPREIASLGGKASWARDRAGNLERLARARGARRG